MPFIRLIIADPALSGDTRRSLAAEFTRLVDHELDKEPLDTVVQVTLVPPQSWFVGGRPTTGGTGVHCELSITAGTNTEAQKAEFLRRAHATIGSHLGVLPGAVYVALYELDGRSYGFNGVSQHARALAHPGHRD
jgi:4-oxalocrotonate tautomerase